MNDDVAIPIPTPAPTPNSGSVCVLVDEEPEESSVPGFPTETPESKIGEIMESSLSLLFARRVPNLLDQLPDDDDKGDLDEFLLLLLKNEKAFFEEHVEVGDDTGAMVGGRVGR